MRLPNLTELAAIRSPGELRPEGTLADTAVASMVVS
jgi:hypothetical protein